MIPIVSVCIANYNGMNFIKACLDSVMAQDCDFPVEIIVHDDASSDGSAEFIRKYFPQVVLIESLENVGFCVSNNRMAAQARGRYILLLNNDAELFPDALRKLYDHAEKQDKPAILGLVQYHAASGMLIDRGLLFDLFLNSVPNLNAARHEVGMLMGACLWLPKKLWDELGGFPDFFSMLAEDAYLCCIARLKGCSVEVLNDSGFNHWVGASLGGGKVVEHRLSTSFKRRALTERNKSFVMAICYPNPIFGIIFPAHLFLLILEGAVLSLIKQDKSFLRNIYLAAMGDLWKHRAMLFSLREKTQGLRQITVKQFFKVFTVIPHKLNMLLRYGIPEVR